MSSSGKAQTLLSEIKINSSDCQFIRTGNFLPSSVNSKRYVAAIFAAPKFANLPYSPAEWPCLCDCSSPRKSIYIYLVSEACILTPPCLSQLHFRSPTLHLGNNLIYCIHRMFMLHEKFKCDLTFSVKSHKLINKHMHTSLECTPASVGHAQARPNDR